ncbi:Acyl-CoA dehydrogenase [Halobacillus karajensis]|uniref:Acyl-CoA dehydrogenase AidB n=1 Tax=Halobacillus karajensis TaxID=195088 RepID=A0A059NUZ9_9BACI|nr:acyl-CoA dehydrogenase family protein [Halobacillus karajensis]CDQ19252.1 Putative acyl-CoA dehydrogenase AidB [Halobacillus karajensis]CDQ22674.1 Putative acyl-CoA dehydrogenase AidB [Halobacillus karajensis]CDQ26156.1 Putative acyl-CoA dehydrogenase AidB [Halobacillus karajensis]SEH39376.1 Acyl-CoA dehydrogenase [Halobacillus karajensis]
MNFYESDENLKSLLRTKWDDSFYEWADKKLRQFGSRCAGEIDERAVHTDREGQPRLYKYDKMGNDISEVWLNEGYKKTVQETYGEGIVGYLHKNIPELGRKGDYTYSFAQGYLLSQAEPGFYCPVTLTMATAYLIDHYASKELKDHYLPHVLSTGEVDLFEGATFLTERQGGSDVGANEVEAVKEGDHYRIHGEKYFASNAGACGVAMVLARTEGGVSGTKGLSLFLVPWRKEDGTLNGIQIRRLKDKLGVRAVPSAEVEFVGAKAYMVGEADSGFYYMMEALNLSRVCNVVASIGIMRRSLVEASHYAKKRKAFGSSLIAYPMVKDTLVSLTVNQEVATQTVFDLVHSFEKEAREPENTSARNQILNRLRIAIMKKETAEQAVTFTHEAIEMHGGNGYIEDFVTPRLLRDAQVLTVWEGTANILGLEVLKLFNKYQAHELFIQDVIERIIGRTKEHILVKEAVHSFADYVENVLKQSTEVQTYYSKGLAEKTALLYEAVVALEMVEKGGRSQKIAELFIHHHFGEEKPQAHPLALLYADEVLNVNKAHT